MWHGFSWYDLYTDQFLAAWLPGVTFLTHPTPWPAHGCPVGLQVLCFLSAALLTGFKRQGKHGDSESSFVRTALCHKARGEWVTNCTQLPPTARLGQLARPQPCELKLNGESLCVLSSERIIPSHCFFWQEVVLNYRKLRAEKTPKLFLRMKTIVCCVLQHSVPSCWGEKWCSAAGDTCVYFYRCIWKKKKCCWKNTQPFN